MSKIEHMTLWRGKGDVSWLMNVSPDKIVCFDTETTGFNADDNDEILQLSMIDGNGDVLFSSYIKPQNRQGWPKAQEKNGISPAMVKDSPKMSDVIKEVQDIISGAELIVGYNLEFDLKFLHAAGIRVGNKTKYFDVMKECALGRYNSYRGDYQWVKLEECAEHYNYRFDAHDALEDTKATLFCFFAMLRDKDGYLRLAETGYRADNPEMSNTSDIREINPVVYDEPSKKQGAKSGVKWILIGLAVFVVGIIFSEKAIAVTAISLIVAAVLIIIGIVKVIKGLARKKK